MSEGENTLTFDVEGMTCASCALRIERVLSRQDGIEDAVVNFARQEARLTTNGNVDASTLGAAVRKIGYTIDAVDPDDVRRSLVELYDEEAHQQQRTFVTAAIFAVPVMVLAMLVQETTLVRTFQFLLTIPVVFWAGMQFHKAAWLRLKSLTTNMDSLVSLGTLAAFGYSTWALVSDEPVFFETAAMIVTLILLGRYFEAKAKGEASQAITRLAELGAREARLIRGDDIVVVDPLDLAPGNRIITLPGEKIAADGTIVAGESTIDTSMLTGESIAVPHGVGDAVTAGTINLQSRLEIEVVHVGPNTALARITRLVEEAQASRAPAQNLADRISSIFVPVVVALATLVLIGWLIAGGDTGTAVRNAVAVLIIACPCALGLATPTAVLVGSGRAAELGVLFKNAEAFERMSSIDTVAFDKTGTLTRGAMTLTDLMPDSISDMALRMIGSVEAASGHAIGKAVALGVEERGLELTQLSEVEALPGRGVRGVVDGTTVLVGTPALFADHGITVAQEMLDAMTDWQRQGKTAFLAGWDGEVTAALGVADSIRSSSAATVVDLTDRNIDSVMITGDTAITANQIAGELGISTVIAGVQPADKAEHVERLRLNGSVAFVGDGINDAPALAAADVGLAIGTGTEVAIESADVVLMSGDPATILTTIDLARATFKKIKQNLFWAFAYNVAAIPLAALGYLNPMIAAGAMALSSVSVVSNSLRLRSIDVHTGTSDLFE